MGLKGTDRIRSNAYRAPKYYAEANEKGPCWDTSIANMLHSRSWYAWCEVAAVQINLPKSVQTKDKSSLIEK